MFYGWGNHERTHTFVTTVYYKEKYPQNEKFENHEKKQQQQQQQTNTFPEAGTFGVWGKREQTDRQDSCSISVSKFQSANIYFARSLLIWQSDNKMLTNDLRALYVEKFSAQIFYHQ